jgi:hypothetical protein
MGFPTKYKTEEEKKQAKLSSQLKHRYGITLGDYNSLLSKQENRCAICDNKFLYSLFVDHDHETGGVRGLLCRQCNTLLGLAKDSSWLLTEAILYLSKSETFSDYARDTLRHRLKQEGN